MSTRVLGYNILLKLATKDIVGTTSHSFSAKSRVKETLTKDDLGYPKKKITGVDYTFAIEGIMELLETGEETTKVGRDEIITLIQAKSPIAFVYNCGTGTALQGELIIDSYDEKSDAENDATYSINCMVNGDLTPVS